MPSHFDRATAGLNQQHELLTSEKQRLIDALDEVRGTLALLRIKCGLPPSATTLRKHGAAKQLNGPAPIRSERDRALEMKRRDAGRLIFKMGYRVENDGQRKAAGVHIVGPGFDEEFYDVADFDGTSNNAID